MVELNCPVCGKPVRLSNVEFRKRYDCKRCFTPFYLDKSGDAIVGEPPSIEADLEEAKQKFQEGLSKVPVKKIASWAAVVVLAYLGWWTFFGPADSLEATARQAASALAAGDVNALKSMAAPGTADDLVRWYDSTHSRLDQNRQRWHGGKDEAVEIHVSQEDAAGHKGAAGITIHPALAGGLDTSLADPAAATASADSPFDAETQWTLNRWGHWKLDGSATYAKVRPTTAAITR